MSCVGLLGFLLAGFSSLSADKVRVGISMDNVLISMQSLPLNSGWLIPFPRSSTRVMRYRLQPPVASIGKFCRNDIASTLLQTDHFAPQDSIQSKEGRYLIPPTV